jgi:hypothetical protein
MKAHLSGRSYVNDNFGQWRSDLSKLLIAIEHINTMTDATTASSASLRFANLFKRRDNASKKINGKS